MATSEAKKARLSEDGRVRVTRACDACKRKKIRCDGDHPCARCIKQSIVCRYETPYNRGKARFGSATSPGESDSVAATLLGGPSKDDMIQPLTAPTNNSTEPEEAQDLGGSSSIAFLLRAKKRLQQYRASAQFTFGDNPLPDFDAASFILPQYNEAGRLVSYYFDFVSPTYRYLHRQTVENQLYAFYYDRLHITKDGVLDRAICATLFMVFATASHYQDPSTTNGVAYFLAARRQVSALTSVTLSSIQAQALMTLYLLVISRLNHAWTLLGSTIRSAQTLSLHRYGEKGDIIENECRKRTFWTLYTLDRTISTILSRPCMIHDQDVDQNLPSLIDDEELIGVGQDSAKEGKCVMHAPREHFKLTRIVSGILSDFYSARKHISEQVALRHLNRLQEWKHNLPAFLDAERLDPDLLLTLFKRQSIILQIAYYHTLLFIYRPFLLTPVGQFPSTWVDHATAESLRVGRMLMKLTNGLVQDKLINGAFWFTIYNAFNAMLIVYVITIQSLVPNAPLPEAFLEAEQCQTQLSGSVVGNAIADRYLLVLEELRSEIRRLWVPKEVPTRNLETLLNPTTDVMRTLAGESWDSFDAILTDAMTSEMLDFVS